jgi:hypothetical protein
LQPISPDCSLLRHSGNAGLRHAGQLLRLQHPDLIISKRKVRQADPSKVDAEVQSQVAWRANRLSTIWKSYDPQQKVDNIPLRLLAVANRLDLGRIVSDKNSKAPAPIICPKGLICGAELHFVYAGALRPGQQDSSLGDGAPYLNLILEFQLPPLSKKDFQELAWLWIGLYELPPDRNRPSDLEPVLEKIHEALERGRPGTHADEHPCRSLAPESV